MITTFFTLEALAREWAPDLKGCTVADAFSQVRGELTLAFARPEQAWMVRVSTQAPFYFMFRSEGYSKARRNVATLFEDAFDASVTAVRMADRDRMLFVDLDNDLQFQVMLFGPRANVFLVDASGTVVEAFQNDAEWRGAPAPPTRPAPDVHTFDAFRERWRTNRKKVVQAVSSALPLFDRSLASEVMERAGIEEKAATACTPEEQRKLFEAAVALRERLARPEPRIYWRGRFADTFALVPMHHLGDLEEEPFDTVDDAVSVFVRRTLAQQRFRHTYEPLEKALVRAHEEAERRTERMLEELSKPSRADRYERWGHLLMARPQAVPAHADEVTLPDLFGGEAPVTIPLDPARSAIENAERYYDKARRTRKAREQAEKRVLASEEQAERAADLLDRLRALQSYRALEAFRKQEAEALAEFVGSRSGGRDQVPFRRFDLGRGYQVWVGRNARQNDELTFRHAQKYDLWMHARGVAGSHAVLRLPNRDAEPDRRIVDQAASIAAYYSKAQGSSLVPVMVAPRKYVRKPKGAAPGAVVVEREDVILVEPRLPENG